MERQNPHQRPPIEAVFHPIEAVQSFVYSRGTTFCQEFVATNLDSDGEYKEDEVYDRQIIKRNEGKSQDISDSKIIQKLKSML